MQLLKNLTTPNPKYLSKHIHLPTEPLAKLTEEGIQRVNGWSYQTMMNDALRQAVQGITIADVVRETIRETLGANLTKEGKRITSKRVA